MSVKNTLVALAIKHNGDWQKIYDDISQKVEVEQEYILKAETLKCKTVTLADQDYPHQLRQAWKPPFVLFYYGDLSIVQDYYKNVSIVGSRDCSEYGLRKTNEISSGLAIRGYTIVSGNAIGIDTEAEKAALVVGGKVVAILPCGIETCYPQSNLEMTNELKKNHLVISEHPYNYQPNPGDFPIRNRIIASLSKTLILTEAHTMSGSLVTATLALKGNADVMCVPHEADKNSECNRLIMNGAILVENVDDVINQMSAF